MLINLVLWGMSILTPFIVGDYIDTLVELGDSNDLYNNAVISNGSTLIGQIVVTLAIIWTLQIIFSYIRNIISARVNSLITFDVNFAIMEHLKRLPISYFTNKDAAYINSRTSSDSGSVTGFVLGSLFGLITTILTFVLALGIMFFINFQMTLVICIIFPIYILIYIKFRKPLYEMGYKLAEESNSFFSTKNKQLSNIKLIKQNAWNERMSNELQSEFGGLFKTTMQNARLGYVFNNADAIVRYMANMIIFIYSGFQIIQGDMTIGQFTIINSYSLMVISSLGVFLGFGRSYRNSLIAYDRIQEIYSERQEENGAIQLAGIDKITIQNLNFGYKNLDGEENNNRTIFKNFNAEFKKGNIYAIVGENGSGKSTLLDILVGLQQGYSGDVVYHTNDTAAAKINTDIGAKNTSISTTHNIPKAGSVNLRELDAYHLRNHHIAIVEQEPILYYDDISQNLDNDNQLYFWAKRLNIHDLIANYTSAVNDESNPNNAADSSIANNKNISHNTNLSGGEKQRLITAAALAKDAGLIIMDEPSSALDKGSLKVLCEILQEIKTDRIVILVTHDRALIEIGEVYYI